MPVCLVHQDLPDICGMYSTIFMCNKENQVEIVHIQNFQIVMVKSRLQTCQLLQEQLSCSPIVVYFPVYCPISRSVII